MSATPGMKTDLSDARVGRVTIANAYLISGATKGILGGNNPPDGLSPSSSIAIDGNNPAFQQPSSGVVTANLFAGQVFAIGPAPGDYTGNNTLLDETFMRQHGAGTVTLPANPWDGMRVVIMDADGTATGSPISIQRSGSQLVQAVYNDSKFVAGTTIQVPWQCVEFVWDAVGTNVNGGTNPCWRIAYDSKSDILPIVSTTVSAPLSGRGHVLADTTGGALTLTMTSSPTDGMVVRVKDKGGAAGANNITIAAAGAGWLIQPVNSTGAVPAATCVISNNRAGAEWIADVTNKIWWARCIL